MTWTIVDLSYGCYWRGTPAVVIAWLLERNGPELLELRMSTTLDQQLGFTG